MITSLALSPDKIYIASSCINGLVKIYSQSTEEVFGELFSHNPVHSIAFDKETENLLAVNEIGTVYKTNIYKKTRNIITSKNTIKSWGTGIAPGPNNSYGLCSTSGEIKIIIYNGYSYSLKSKSVLTKIGILPNNAKLSVMVLVFKGGLKLYKAEDMKFST